MILKDKTHRCFHLPRKIAIAVQRLELVAAALCILAASVNAGRYDPAYPGMENRIHGGGAAYFPEQSNKVAAEIGSKVVIPCKILNLTNESVSWFRVKTKDILTVDDFTFIADDRVSARWVPKTATSLLEISKVQPDDEGVYECQVSTDPKKSRRVHLSVRVPLVEIIGGQSMYVQSGSPVALRCKISGSLQIPGYVHWYHDSEKEMGMITMSKESPKIVTHGKNGTVQQDYEVFISTLTLNDVKKEDAGNYTCQPVDLPPASVQLHVIQGENPAAMHHKNSSSSAQPTATFGVVVILASVACKDWPGVLMTTLGAALASLFDNVTTRAQETSGIESKLKKRAGRVGDDEDDILGVT